MREIKFRAQHRLTQEWKVFKIPVDLFIAREDALGEWHNYGEFTGFKDKKGVEIYEGHIVSMFHETQTSEVFWDKFGMWNVIAQTAGGDSKPNSVLLGNFADECEVIGNIYEHPDLLSSQKA